MIIMKPKLELDSFNDTQNLDVKYGLNRAVVDHHADRLGVEAQ
jgi:hypothetical protein